ncbi:MAG: leucine-rich repeat domain-containing protein, partial [Aureispira sp.]|nr:leucine-rich repeat domain-containing protein [Aureispira sp.]
MANIKSLEIEEALEIKNLEAYARDLKGKLSLLAACKNLEVFVCKRKPRAFWPRRFRQLPSELFELNKLQKLIFFDAKLQTLAGPWGNLEALEYLDLSKNELSTVPKELLQLPKLKELKLAHNPIRLLPPSLIKKMGSLEVLNLNENKLTKLPAAIGELFNLRSLGLLNNNIKKLPLALIKLEQLEELNLLKNNYLQPFPKVLIKLKQLKKLYLSAFTLRKTKELISELLDEIPYVYSHTSLEKNHLEDFQLYSKDWNLSEEEEYLCLNLLAENSLKVKRFASFDSLLRLATTIPLQAIAKGALAHLGTVLPTENLESLKKGASLALIGSFSSDIEGLRNKLDYIDINLTESITEKTTHLLVGINCAVAYHKLLSQKSCPYHLVTEKAVLNFLEERGDFYLLEKTEDQETIHANVCQLLINPAIENIQLALTTIKEGGFAKEWLTELLIAYYLVLAEIGHYWAVKKHEYEPIIEEIRQLAERYGSFETRAAFDGYSLFELFRKRLYRKEIYLIRGLKKIRTNPELDAVQIARFTFKNYQTGLSYLLKYLDKRELRIRTRNKR